VPFAMCVARPRGAGARSRGFRGAAHRIESSSSRQLILAGQSGVAPFSSRRRLRACRHLTARPHTFSRHYVCDSPNLSSNESLGAAMLMLAALARRERFPFRAGWLGRYCGFFILAPVSFVAGCSSRFFRRAGGLERDDHRPPAGWGGWLLVIAHHGFLGRRRDGV